MSSAEHEHETSSDSEQGETPDSPSEKASVPETELEPTGGLGMEISEVEDPERREQRTELARRVVEKPYPTAMLHSFGYVIRLIARFLFAHVLFERRCIDSIRDAERRGSVVYVMESRSLLDYLYYNWAFVKNDLPIARFSNGTRTVFLRGFFAWLGNLFRGRSKEKSEEVMQALVANDEPVFLFLEKPKARPDENVEYSQKYLYRLIRAQKTSPEPIFVTPLLLVWERRPDPKHASILEDIFGSAQSPGFFRKFIYWFQTMWQSFLRVGQPFAQVSTAINLQEFLREYPNADSADSSELLRERLLDFIEQERRVILGPVAEEPPSLWRDISQRPELISTVKDVAEEEDEPEDEIMERAKDQFEEIAAQPNLMVLKVFSAILSLVWYRIYHGLEIDEEGLEMVREAARDSSIVLIPSHKSHVDYLILSYIFYHYGLNPPFIAAGVNLSFWPLGWLFRRAGAFFIRRSFKGETLYPVVFREYLIRVMEEGFPIEFFIEGTRSRTGKLVKPKYGMLEMILRAYGSGRLESVKLVPISVAYEKIIEEGAYESELLGGEKEKESLTGLLKTPKFLTTEYGRLYIEFNEPISVGEYFDKYEIARITPTKEKLEALTVRLAHRIIYDINEVTTVTPTALAATVLLNNEARGIDRQRLLREVGFLLHFLTQPDRNVRLSRTLRDALAAKRAAIKRLARDRARSAAEDDVEGGDRLARLVSEAEEPDIETVMGNAVSDLMEWSLSRFEETDQVEVEESDGEQFYSVPEEARVGLSYYRNNIVHHFVPEGLLAAAIRKFRSSDIQLDELMDETLFLSRLFKYEWIYEERAEFQNVFMRTLRYFEGSGWVTVHWEEERGETTVEIDDPPPVELDFFRRLVLTFLEAYAIMASFLPRLAEEPWEKSDLLGEALNQARNDYMRGRILYHESLSKPTYENALRLMRDWGIVERDVDENKKKSSYQITDEWREDERWMELQDHLEEFVYPEGRDHG